MWTWAWTYHSRYETQRETVSLLYFFRVCCKSTSIYTGGLSYIHPPYTTDYTRKISMDSQPLPLPENQQFPPLKIGQQKPPQKREGFVIFFEKHLEFSGPNWQNGEISRISSFVCTASPLMALAARYLGQDSAFLICPSRWKQRWGERREFAAMDGWMIRRWWQPDIWGENHRLDV